MKEELIALDFFCRHCRVEISFVKRLSEFGLVELVEEEDNFFIPSYEIGHLERLSRLHYDIGINTEGLEAIQHLLDKIEQLQTRLKKAELEIMYWQQLAK
ncbi:chaperone modulator CbpM [Pleomorphovibrio marinus]|uniref:chaperone modulator CbpM n=1 Tax=Pleomorphovibrio marinus TaxID=2164132 RepID=UPI000E0C783F|nr:chaperone modulator CbpM [Pleomorphovibrio marinus]